MSRVIALWPLALVEWLAGRWQRALEHAIAAYELTLQNQHPHAQNWVGRARALIETDLGLVDNARATAEEALARVAGELERDVHDIRAGRARACGTHARESRAAGDKLRELPERLRAGAMNDPTLPVWADAIETLSL